MRRSPVVHIKLTGDGAFPELQGKKIHHVGELTFTALPGGMESGRTSIAIIIELDDGSAVFAESSLRAFLATARAFQAKYGDE